MKYIEYILYTLFLGMAYFKCFAISKTQIQIYCAIGILIISSLYLFFNLRHLKNIRSLIIAMLIYLFTLLLSIVPSLQITTFYDYINSLLLPLLFLTSYIFFKKYPNKYNLLKYIGAIGIVFAYFNLIRLSSEVNLISNRPMQSNAGNTLVAMLPFVILWKNKIVKYGLFLLIFVGCIISLKRSSFIIFIAIILFYFALKNYNGNFTKILKYLLVICLTCIIILPNIDTAQPLIERLEKTSEDGGSGRDQLIKLGLNVLSNNSLHEWILGNGYRGFSNRVHFLYGKLFTCSHNDYVEILCNMGIFSFIAFVLLIYKLYAYSRKMYLSRNIFSIPFICCFIVFIGANLFVCSFIHYWYYLPMFCLFGATYALTEKI